MKSLARKMVAGVHSPSAEILCVMPCLGSCRAAVGAHESPSDALCLARLSLSLPLLQDQGIHQRAETRHQLLVEHLNAQN